MHDDLICVFLVAENRLLREALARLLCGKPDLKVSGSSAFVPCLAKTVVSAGTDVLILDSINARNSECPRLIAELARSPHCIKILLTDMEEDSESLLNAVRAGAVGYLLKDASAAEVVTGVRSVMKDQAVCPPQLCMTLFEAISQQSKSFDSRARGAGEKRLTRRQQQLIPMIADGLTNKEIAGALHVSEQTVKNHLYRIMRRVGATDRLEAVNLTDGGDHHSSISRA